MFLLSKTCMQASMFDWQNMPVEHVFLHLY